MFKANDLPLLSSVSSQVEDAPEYLVAQCRDWRDAFRLCMSLSRVKQPDSEWAKVIGMAPGTFSYLLGAQTGRARYPNPAYFKTMQEFSGNNAIYQFFELESKGRLNHQNAKLARINELEAELAALKHG